MIRSLILLAAPILCLGFSRLTSVTRTEVTTPVIVGSTPPIENFDPLGFSKNEQNALLYREAELKHGRLAMISALCFPLIEGSTHQPAIHQFSNLPANSQLGIVGLMFISEFSSMVRGWKNPFDKSSTSNYFKIAKNYQPGDFGFSTGLDLESDEGKTLLNKELNNGRLAMIGVLGMMAQELVSNKAIF
tara:strand:- start:10731 stop:11297 length:567 start_codon:yes stop_codon:yes gene_type:complete